MDATNPKQPASRNGLVLSLMIAFLIGSVVAAVLSFR